MVLDDRESDLSKDTFKADTLHSGSHKGDTILEPKMSKGFGSNMVQYDTFWVL